MLVNGSPRDYIAEEVIGVAIAGECCKVEGAIATFHRRFITIRGSDIALVIRNSHSPPLPRGTGQPINSRSRVRSVERRSVKFDPHPRSTLGDQDGYILT